MPANVSTDHRRDEVISAVRTARDLIASRGYQPLYGTANEGGPINISNALTRASSDRDLYIRCRQSFSKNWGGPLPGLLHWETEKRRTASEVMDLFARVLTRLENGETQPTGTDARTGTRAT